jgi:hypothetical protein
MSLSQRQAILIYVLIASKFVNILKNHKQFDFAPIGDKVPLKTVQHTSYTITNKLDKNN